MNPYLWMLQQLWNFTVTRGLLTDWYPTYPSPTSNFSMVARALCRDVDCCAWLVTLSLPVTPLATWGIEISIVEVTEVRMNYLVWQMACHLSKEALKETEKM